MTNKTTNEDRFTITSGPDRLMLSAIVLSGIGRERSNDFKFQCEDFINACYGRKTSNSGRDDETQMCCFFTSWSMSGSFEAVGILASSAFKIRGFYSPVSKKGWLKYIDGTLSGPCVL